MKATTLTNCWRWSAAPSPHQRKKTHHIGDTAPKLQVGKWIQGEPGERVRARQGAHRRVLGHLVRPRAAFRFRHLNETHVKFKDRGLVVIGQGRMGARRKSLVAPFCKKDGEK